MNFSPLEHAGLPGLKDVSFTQEDLSAAATRILDEHPDPVPALRLLTEVLRLPGGDARVQKAAQAARQTRWVRQLESAQLPDGSWGRFHSQDTKVKHVFRTSEEAIDRAFALGKRVSEGILERAKLYILKVLQGEALITDWDEKNDAWPVLIKLILAGRLAQIDPAQPILDASCEYLKEVARLSFITGRYRLEDEIKAFQDLSRIHIHRGFLHTKYSLWILSARPLPRRLEHALLEWVWNKHDGIGYLGTALSVPQPRAIAGWLRSMNIIARFPSWRAISFPTLNQIWEGRGCDDWWDFGRQTSSWIDYPISESWRKVINRKVDYSTCVLALLRKVFD